MRFIDLFADVRKSPSMFMISRQCQSVIAFVEGVDFAFRGGGLAGFREWLVVKNNGGNNLGWPAHILFMCYPDKFINLADLGNVDHRMVTDTMFELIEAFESEKEKKGLGRIFREYEEWYDEELNEQT